MRLPSPRASWMRIGFAICTLLAIGMLLISEFDHHRSRQDVEEMSRRLEAQRLLQGYVGTLLDAETAQRGYLLTGDARYLGHYGRAVSALDDLTASLRDRYRDDARAAPLADALVAAASARLTELDLTVRLRRGGRPAAAGDVVLTDLGRERMDAVRRQAAALADLEERRRAEVVARWNEVRDGVRLAIALSAALVVLAFFVVMRQSQTLAREREAQRRALQAERDALDAKVARRTDELVRLASHLQNSREDERATLARELHDELGAVLTAAKLDLAWLSSRLRDQPEVVERLRAMRAMLDSGIELKRRIIEDLRPSMLSNLGLLPALERLVEEQRQRFDGEIRAELDPAVELEEPAALVLYRVVQEAFTNIHKYAHATRVDLTLRRLPRHVELRIGDDGTGFDLKDDAAAGHGLAGMRHRLLSLRGRLLVETAPGRGTVITALVPLEGERPAVADTAPVEPAVTLAAEEAHPASRRTMALVDRLRRRRRGGRQRIG